MMAELFSRKCTFESVPVKKIFFCKYLLPFQLNPKTKVPTVQAELAVGHPMLSVCVYLWETGLCNDLPLILAKWAQM